MSFLFLFVLLGCKAPAPQPLEALERVSGGGSGDLPTVVVLHGLGDRPESMMRIFASFDRPARIVAPRAPLPYGDGTSWFPVDFGPDGARSQAEDVAARADEVVQWARARTGSSEALVITGFSQGGMLSYAAAVRHPELVSAAIPVSGALHRTSWPAALPDPAPPIRGLHGSEDEVVPLLPTSEAVAHLAGLGWPADLQVFPGAEHEVTPDMHRAWFARVAEALEAGPHTNREADR